MRNFHLQIVTPDGSYFDGLCQQVTLRSIDGEIGIQADHIPFVTALGSGECRILTDEGTRRATCSGGMLTVTREVVRVLSSSFAWEK